MKNSVVSVFKLIFGWPLTLVAFYFLWKIFLSQSKDFSFSLSHLRYDYVVISLFSFTFYFLFRCFLWQKIINQFNHHPSLAKTTYFWSISEIKRYIPGNIWSYLGRGVLFKSIGMSGKELVNGFFLEIQLLLVSTMLLSLPALYYLGEAYHFPMEYFGGLTALIFIGLFGYLFQAKLHDVLPKKLQNLTLHILLPFAPLQLFLLLLFTFFSFLLFGVGYLFAFLAINSISSPILAMSISLLSFVIGYLSLLTPSGLGVREWALTIGLASFASPADAVTMALLGRILLTLGEVMALGVSVVWYKISE